MGLDVEACKTIRDLACCFRHVSSGATTGEAVEDTTDDTQRQFGSCRFLFGGDVGDVVDEDEGVMQQFFSGVGECNESACGLQGKCDVDIVGVILPAGLDEFGVERGVLGGVAAEAEPFGYHLLRDAGIVEQLLGMKGVLLDLSRRERVTVSGFVVALLVSLYTTDILIIYHARACNGMVVVLVGDRQGVKGFVYLRSELIFGMIDQDQGKGIAAVGQLLLCLCGNDRTSTEQC